MTHITIHGSDASGPLEFWRHTLGHGGINSLPLPARVVQGVSRLKPRLIRIFLQEFFHIYRGQDQFDWEKLDPYMDAFARTGAKVVAAITIKPRALYPVMDHAQWRPQDVAEWQQVIAQLVRRYSVERPFVTHWEVGNEPDIGEAGGCPYLIRAPHEYAEYYSMTVQAVLEAFPQAKVGGPANAGLCNEPLPGLIQYCKETGTPLDFLSWHLYHSDPGAHAEQVRAAQALHVFHSCAGRRLHNPSFARDSVRLDQDPHTSWRWASSCSPARIAAACYIHRSATNDPDSDWRASSDRCSTSRRVPHAGTSPRSPHRHRNCAAPDAPRCRCASAGRVCHPQTPTLECL